MLRLHSVGGGEDADIFVKMELLNPGFSVKDRIGIGMIERAERAGVLKPGGTIIEPTAGNTGIGLALAGVQMGYRVILCVPENFSLEKRELMKALGGEVFLTPKDQGMKAAIAKAEELAGQIEGAYVPQQFVNPFNTESHYETMGPEIWDQMARTARPRSVLQSNWAAASASSLSAPTRRSATCRRGFTRSG